LGDGKAIDLLKGADARHGAAGEDFAGLKDPVEVGVGADVQAQIAGGILGKHGEREQPRGRCSDTVIIRRVGRVDKVLSRRVDRFVNQLAAVQRPQTERHVVDHVIGESYRNIERDAELIAVYRVRTGAGDPYKPNVPNEGLAHELDAVCLYSCESRLVTVHDVVAVDIIDNG
jgi:hypothetical protein